LNRLFTLVVFSFTFLVVPSYLSAQLNLASTDVENVDSLTIGVYDSLATQLNEVLQETEALKERLLFEADSTHKADSLQQLAILAQITALKANDAKQKALLKAQLDSIKFAQDMRDMAIKRQVDSLRTSTVGIPAILYQDTVFYFFAKIGPFSPQERASIFTQKLKTLVDDGLYSEKKLKIVENQDSFDILHNNVILVSITERDAFWLNSTQAEVAELHLQEITAAVENYKKQTGIIRTLLRSALLIFILFLFFLGIKYLNKAFTWVNKWIQLKVDPLLSGVQFKNYEFLSKDRQQQFIQWLMKVGKWVTIAFIVYLALPIALSIFPSTQVYATALINYILDPLISFATALISYIPQLITIIVFIYLTRYVVRLLKFFSLEVEAGKLEIPGFYPDWAAPTFNLIKVIIYAFSFIIIFPYLPGSDSEIFRGVSVFFGLLISLGSSSAIGNIIAGLVITYMRAFKIGDRVKIGDTTGSVIEKTMLVTRVRTIKNEDVTIPNAAILNGSTINYSTSAKQLGLILNTSITIGYDVPWRIVQELLLEAALKTAHIKHEPKPFVLQTSLDDFYVSYQINAYTDQPGISAMIYSELHSHILDGFHSAGVEIMSPHYQANRDGSDSTIPKGL
jgi:small-conductance mechanosensitive channel